MKKLFIIILASLLVIGCSYNNKTENLSLIEQKIIQNGIESNSKIKIGYCPTMQKYVDKIKNKDTFDLAKFSSTVEVLEQLKNNNIGIALIGRIAKSYEIDKNIKSQKLLDEERFTYISNTKIGILETEIPKYKDRIKLISWDNWKDEYELTVIFDNLGNKVEKYRLPILYFN